MATRAAAASTRKLMEVVVASSADPSMVATKVLHRAVEQHCSHFVILAAVEHVSPAARVPVHVPAASLEGRHPAATIPFTCTA
jgi:hypothetical protein